MITATIVTRAICGIIAVVFLWQFVERERVETMRFAMLILFLLSATIAGTESIAAEIANGAVWIVRHIPGMLWTLLEGMALGGGHS